MDYPLGLGTGVFQASKENKDCQASVRRLGKCRSRVFFETSEEQIRKKQEQSNIISGVCCDTLPSGKIRTLPVAAAGLFDLITVGGILANVPRWDAS